MSNKHLNITYAYHFLSEAIIIFLIAIPILYLQYRWIPYWSYLFVVIFLCLVFSFLAKRTTNYSVYLVVGLVLLPIFYFLNYPLIVNLAFTALLIWRYINVRSRTMVDLNRENGYIIAAIILTTLGVLIVKDSEIIIYAATLVILLVFGNILSHLAVISKEDRRRFDRRSVAYILGPIILGTLIFIPFFHTGKFLLLKLWAGFRYLVYIFASSIGRVLQLFEQDRGWGDIVNIEESRPPIDDEVYQKLGAKSLIEILAPYAIIMVGLIVITVIVVLAIKLSKKVFKPLNQIPTADLVSYTSLSEETKEHHSLLDAFKKRFRKPSDPIRRYVYEFERRAIQHEYGRKPFETLEEWLKRMGLETNLEIYQKVRYGEEEVSKREGDKLKDELKHIESSLRSD